MAASEHTSSVCCLKCVVGFESGDGALFATVGLEISDGVATIISLIGVPGRCSGGDNEVAP
jgi:hypothetical protein